MARMCDCGENPTPPFFLITRSKHQVAYLESLNKVQLYGTLSLLPPENHETTLEKENVTVLGAMVDCN